MDTKLSSEKTSICTTDAYTTKRVESGSLRKAFISPVPVRYETKDGWQAIDNTLKQAVADGQPVWQNTASAMTATFPETSGSGSIAAVAYNGFSLSWTFDGLREVNADVKNHTDKDDDGIESRTSEITYKEILAGADIRFALVGLRCKEDIIIRERTAAESIAVRVKGKGLRFERRKDNGIDVYAKDGSEKETAPVFSFAAPTATDSSGNDGVAVDYEIAETEDGVILKYQPDAAWLDSAVFPIVIDPTVEVSGYNNAEAFYVIQGTPGINQSYLRTGITSAGNERVSLIRFTQLAELDAGDTVVEAKLRIYPDYSSKQNPMYVGAYIPGADWSMTEITGWDSLSNVLGGAKPLDVVTRTDSNYVEFDITSEYRKWVKDASANRGILLRKPALVSDTSRYPATFNNVYSNNNTAPAGCPRLEVTYYSHAGQESRWNYQSLGAGRAGVLAADLFNGNVVAAHGDVSVGGLRGSVSVAHTYNSCQCGADDFFCGYGWRTGMHQSVHEETVGDDTWYVWTDGDGTEHYFKIEDNPPYHDEDGLRLKLTYTSTTVTITDMKDNVMTFTKETGWEKYWLTETKDALQNAVTVTYLAERKIDRVTDPVGRYVQYTYTNDRLSSLSVRKADGTDAGYPGCGFTYTDGNLMGVTYTDLASGRQTAYTYSANGHLLTGVANYDGLTVTAAYEEGTDDEKKRVISLEQTGGGVASTKMLFGYSHQSTKVTFLEQADEPENANEPESSTDTESHDHELFYQFNERGNIASVRDSAGYATYKTYDAEHPNYPDVASRLQRTNVNLLINHGFEKTTGTTNWTTAKLDGATGTHSYATDKKRQGTYSAKMARTNSQGVMTISQDVTVTRGETYTFSGYVRTSADTVQGRAAVLLGSVTLSEGLAITSVDEWTRIHATFTVPTAANETMATVTVRFEAIGGSGSAWFDCTQLEYGETANRYNMLENGCFERVNADNTPANWTAKSENSATEIVVESGLPAGHPEYIGGKALKVVGYPNRNRGFLQDVNIYGQAGDAYTVGGWASATSRPTDGVNRRFDLRVDFYSYPGNSWQTGGMVHWRGGQMESPDWEYISGGVKAPCEYTKIRVTIDYRDNIGEAYFDGISLYKETFGEEYSYYSNIEGLPNHVRTLAGNRDTRIYDAYGNLERYAVPGVSDHDRVMVYGFDGQPNKKHLLRYTNSPMLVQDVYGYDSYGNETSHKHQDTNYAQAIRTTKAYTTDGDKLSSQTDSRGNTSSYTYNADDTPQSVTAANGQTVSYTYDASRRITGVESVTVDGTYKNAYTYENDRLKTVSHNTDGTACDVTYEFEYDSLGRQKKVKVVGTTQQDDRTLSESEYDADRFGKLRRTRFGNDQGIEKEYDRYGRDIGTKVITYDQQGQPVNVDTETRYQYRYGANGQIAVLKDNKLNREVWNEYDAANRPSRITEREQNGGLIRQAGLTYDGQEHVATYKERIATGISGAGEYQTAFYYDYDDRMTFAEFGGSSTNRVQYTYDGLGRLIQYRPRNGGTSRDTDYTYLASTVPIPGMDTAPTTSLIQTITQTGVSFSYGYDTTTANIVSETRTGGSYAGTVTYVYDKLGQLKRVNDPTDPRGGSSGTTWLYTYDLGGNIIKKRRYAYTTGSVGTCQSTHTYAYDDDWKDLLVRYHGTDLTNDAIGNLTYDGTWTYTWEAGRQLKSMSKTGTVISYDYDRNGLRVRKTVNGVETNYTLNGTQITHLMKGTDWMHFYYGAGEKPVLVNFNGTMYTYVYSLQGDVVALLNSAGQVVVEYKYDAWGNVIGKTGSLVSTLGYLNPFRYRGYVYDEETGLYYLRSRYYKAAWGRFIGTDSLIYKDTQLFNINIFAYCANNPIGRYDSSGHWFLNILVGAAVNVAITFIAAKVTGQDYTWQDAGIAALAGAANAIPLFGPLIGGVISGVYTMHMASQHGATVENSIWVGLLAGTATIYSISNLAVYSEVSLTIGATAATDLVFGTGYNIIAAAVFKTVTSSENDIDEDTIKEFYDFSKLSKKIPNKDHLVICTIY